MGAHTTPHHTTPHHTEKPATGNQQPNPTRRERGVSCLGDKTDKCYDKLVVAITKPKRTPKRAQHTHTHAKPSQVSRRSVAITHPPKKRTPCMKRHQAKPTDTTKPKPKTKPTTPKSQTNKPDQSQSQTNMTKAKHYVLGIFVPESQ